MIKIRFSREYTHFHTICDPDEVDLAAEHENAALMNKRQTVRLAGIIKRLNRLQKWGFSEHFNIQMLGLQKESNLRAIEGGGVEDTVSDESEPDSPPESEVEPDEEFREKMLDINEFLTHSTSQHKLMRRAKPYSIPKDPPRIRDPVKTADGTKTLRPLRPIEMPPLETMGRMKSRLNDSLSPLPDPLDAPLMRKKVPGDTSLLKPFSWDGKISLSELLKLPPTYSYPNSRSGPNGRPMSPAVAVTSSWNLGQQNNPPPSVSPLCGTSGDSDLTDSMVPSRSTSSDVVPPSSGEESSPSRSNLPLRRPGSSHSGELFVFSSPSHADGEDKRTTPRRVNVSSPLLEPRVVVERIRPDYKYDPGQDDEFDEDEDESPFSTQDSEKGLIVDDARLNTVRVCDLQRLGIIYHHHVEELFITDQPENGDITESSDEEGEEDEQFHELDPDRMLRYLPV